jgi:hypothetical protein
LNDTHKKLRIADPIIEIRAEVSSELGSGRNRSNTTPISGASITIEARETLVDFSSKPSPNSSEEF